LESSKVIDLEMFIPRGEVDPVYFNSPYYLYPDGQMAVEAILPAPSASRANLQSAARSA
jgi:DNA end-binding protein Ku